MNCLTLRAVPDLMAATGAVSHDDGVGMLAHGGQQTQLGHLHRHVVVRCLIAETTGHAAAAGLDQLRLCTRNQFEHIDDRADRAKRFLVAMAVKKDGLGGRQA